MKNNNNPNRVPLVNNDPFFSNYPNFTNEYIIKSINMKVKPTPYEIKVLNNYFLTDMGFCFDKDINTNSTLVAGYIDFARYYSNRN
jgi:hypothetical protein